MDNLLQWIDLIWLPLGLAVVHKDQRFWTFSCLVGCMVMMRLLAELMESIGHPNGILGMIAMPVAARGQIVYNFYYMVYIMYAFFLRSTGAIFMAASLGVFFLAFFTFAFVMAL